VSPFLTYGVYTVVTAERIVPYYANIRLQINQ